MSIDVNRTILALVDRLESRVENLSYDTNTRWGSVEARFAVQPQATVVPVDLVKLLSMERRSHKYERDWNRQAHSQYLGEWSMDRTVNDAQCSYLLNTVREARHTESIIHKNNMCQPSRSWSILTGYAMSSNNYHIKTKQCRNIRFSLTRIKSLHGHFKFERSPGHPMFLRVYTRQTRSSTIISDEFLPLCGYLK